MSVRFLSENGDGRGWVGQRAEGDQSLLSGFVGLTPTLGLEQDAFTNHHIFRFFSSFATQPKKHKGEEEVDEEEENSGNVSLVILESFIPSSAGGRKNFSNTPFLVYKNTFYKNIQAKTLEKIRTSIRTFPASILGETNFLSYFTQNWSWPILNSIIFFSTSLYFTT